MLLGKKMFWNWKVVVSVTGKENKSILFTGQDGGCLLRLQPKYNFLSSWDKFASDNLIIQKQE